jgi:hypothetical protein
MLILNAEMRGRNAGVAECAVAEWRRSARRRRWLEFAAALSFGLILALWIELVR